MSNSQTIAKNCRVQQRSDSEGSDLSDSQTLNHSNQKYEYLINQIKMKSAALAKASNLIQILQLELEVQKNSKKQAISIAEQRIKETYEIEINNLNRKILLLESPPDKKRISTVYNTENSVLDFLPRQQSKSLKKSCSRSLNRSRSKDNIQVKQPNLKKLSSSQFCFEKMMYRKMLLQNSVQENRHLQSYQNLIETSASEISVTISNINDIDQQFDDFFFQSQEPKKKNSVFNHLQELNNIIKKQQQIITELRLYQSQLEEIIKASVIRFESIYEQKILNVGRKQPSLVIGEAIQDINGLIKNQRKRNKDRERKMESENKELRLIMEQMISLVNRTKSNSGLRSH